MKGDIGLLGGSFNPVHIGHLNLAIEMQERHQLHEVWFSPATISPFKQHEKSVEPKHRLAMLQLAIADIPGFKIIDYELTRPGPSYTIDTIEFLLNEMNKQPVPRQLHLIIGDDMLEGLPNWHRIDDIIRLVPLLVGCRLSKYELEKIENPLLQKAVDRGMTETRRMEISSTDVRNRLSAGLCCRSLVTEKVLDYINKHHLY